MATSGDKFTTYLNENDIFSVIKIQALVRGVLVRKQLKELQDVYREILSELQGDSDTDVFWKDNFCKPQILTKSQVKKLESQRQERLANIEVSKPRIEPNCASPSPRSSWSDTEKLDKATRRSQTSYKNVTPRSEDHSLNVSSSNSLSHQSVNIQTESGVKLDEAKEKDIQESMLYSVETQTSFIEIRQDEHIFAQNNVVHSHVSIESSKLGNSQEDLELITSELNINEEINTDQIEKVDSENDLHLHLDSDRSDHDREQGTMQTLPDETERLQLPDDDVTLRKDVDQYSETSEKLSGRLSSRSNKSQKSSARSVSSTHKGRKDSEVEVVAEIDSDVAVSGPGPVPYSKVIKSETSPAPRSKRLDKHRLTNHDSSSLTNVTSVWDSMNSVRDSHSVDLPSTLPIDPEQLKTLRKNIAMELLWVQQAIHSRKNYLRLKEQM